MMNPCGCYYGKDCTKTTVCQMEAGLEDLREELAQERTKRGALMAVVEAARFIPCKTGAVISRDEAERLQAAFNKLDSAPNTGDEQ